MTYDALVARLAQRTGLHSDVVKKVLWYFPDVLGELAVGGLVLTPLGAFRMTERQPRTTLLPDGKTVVAVSHQRIVKLRPGARLKSGD